MDYKKKYEVALEMARIYRDNAKAINDPSAERYENIFPELAESEEEKIRKFLIDYFHVIGSTCPDGMWKGFSLKDIYSWLERQTEEKHPDGCFTCGDYKKGYEAGRSNGFTAGFNKAMKEQKPVTDDLDQEVHRFFEECITVHDAKIYGIEERVIPVDCYEVTARHFAKWQKEQDSAEWRKVTINGEPIHTENHSVNIPLAEWNEEDEDIRDTIIRDLKHLGGDIANVKPAYKTEVDWLKSLPERFNLQPKQEWSEEDEKILHGIEQCVYDNVANIGTVNKVKYINFLESLRYDKKEIPMPDSTKLLEMWKDVEKMLKDKSENDPNWETWRIAYNAFLSGFGKGLMVKQQ